MLLIGIFYTQKYEPPFLGKLEFKQSITNKQQQHYL